MKKSKNISLYRVLILLIINLFLHNTIIYIISIIYLFIDNSKNIILFLVLFLIIIFTNCIKDDFINIGIVEEKRANYYVVDKILYKVQIISNDLEIGDIVKTDKSNLTNINEDYLKYNIRFCYNKALVIGRFNLRYHFNKYIESFDDNSKLFISKILMNDYVDSSIINVGYGFSFYLLLVFVSKRHKHLAFLLCLFYIVVINFDIKLWLFIIDYFLSIIKVKKFNKLFYKSCIILMINYHLLNNYSILLALLFSFFSLLDTLKNKSNLLLIESLLFYRVEPLMIYLYKYLVYLKIFEFIFTVLYLIFNTFSNLYLLIMNIIVKFYNLILIGFNGKINYFLLIIYILTIYLFKPKDIFKSILLIIMIISQLNNPIPHVSFIDVGQGDSILIHTGLTNFNVLIDTGSTYNYSKLNRYLKKEGIHKIDYLIISHEDSDHSGNINNICNDFIVEDIVLNGKDIIYNDLNLKYLDLKNTNNDINDNSLVYYLNYHNVDFLFTGDISSNIENNINNIYKIGDIDVLKVSHHGSNSASSRRFVSSLLPRFSIISTSGAYGHPSKDTLSILQAYMSNIYITKDNGTVSFYLLDFINFIVSNNKIDLFVS